VKLWGGLKQVKAVSELFAWKIKLQEIDMTFLKSPFQALACRLRILISKIIAIYIEYVRCKAWSGAGRTKIQHILSTKIYIRILRAIAYRYRKCVARLNRFPRLHPYFSFFALIHFDARFIRVLFRQHVSHCANLTFSLCQSFVRGNDSNRWGLIYEIFNDVAHRNFRNSSIN